MNRYRWILVVFIVIFLIQAACNLPAELPDTGGTPQAERTLDGGITRLEKTATPQAQGTPVLSVLTGVISGVVWRDVCIQGGESQPVPASPGQGCTPAPEGEFQANGFRDPQEPGISNLTVNLGAGSCPSTGLAQAVTDSQGTYIFAGLVSGAYCVSVDPAEPGNSVELTSGGWSFPVAKGSSQTIVLESGDHRTDVNFGWDAGLKVAAVEPTAQAPQSSAACTNLAGFVSDVTIPDNTILAPGASFTKTWRVRNDGTCTWTPGEYALAFSGGESFQSPQVVGFSDPVPPGNSIDLSVNLVAPESPGVYGGLWMFRVGDPAAPTASFGVGPDGQGPLYTRVVIESAGIGANPTPPSSLGMAPQQPGGSLTGVTFKPGMTSTVVEGNLNPGEVQGYTLRASEGYALIAALDSRSKDLHLEFAGEDGQPLLSSSRADGSQIVPHLPADQRYIVKVVAGGEASPYGLKLEIPALLSLTPGGAPIRTGGAARDGQPVAYLIRGQAGQELDLTLTVPQNAASVSVEGLEDGQALQPASGMVSWKGVLPKTGGYLIRVAPAAGSADFTLQASLQ